jgi:nitric oxide reductase subunit C
MQKRIVVAVLFCCFFIYSIVVYTVGTAIPGDKLLTEKSIAGKTLFQKHNCIACHQVYGLGGYLGPDLTASADPVAHRELYAWAIMKTGTSRMPDFHLTDYEIDCIMEYLKAIDKTATTYHQSEKN